MQANLELTIKNQLQLLTEIQQGLLLNVQEMKLAVQKLDDKLPK